MVDVDGIPEPIVKWFRGDSELVNSPDYVLVKTGATHSLTIMETFPEDSGHFRVVATNAGGSVFSETHLHVKRTMSILYCNVLLICI